MTGYFSGKLKKHCAFLVSIVTLGLESLILSLEDALYLPKVHRDSKKKVITSFELSKQRKAVKKLKAMPNEQKQHKTTTTKIEPAVSSRKEVTYFGVI